MPESDLVWLTLLVFLPALTAVGLLLFPSKWTFHSAVTEPLLFHHFMSVKLKGFDDMEAILQGPPLLTYAVWIQLWNHVYALFVRSMAPTAFSAGVVMKSNFPQYSLSRSMLQRIFGKSSKQRGPEPHLRPSSTTVRQIFGVCCVRLTQ